MKKRLQLLAWMLTLTMLCELLPFGAFAQSDVGQQLALAAAQSLEEENGEATIIGKCGDNLQWSLSSDGVLTIDGTGEMDDYVYVHGSVDRPWSDYLSDIKTVVISSNTTHIGNFAFWNCIYLHSVILPESIVSIGSSAFSACESLTSIDIPASVNSIQSDTLSYCKKLASITIPSSVTSIGSSAFECCTSLATINIPDSVTSIGEHAFDSCSSLTSIDIPKSVIFIGEDAFSSTSLSVIDIPESVTSIEPFTFRDCIVLASVHLPSSLVSIGAEAFTSCSALSSVNIPNGVKSIGENAFSECTSLNSITIPSSVTSLGELVFAGCTSLTSISLPDSIGSIPPRAFDSCSNLTSVNISSGITTIGGRAFYDCISLSSITIPDSVTSIESEAFTGCSFLSSITLPRFITSIDTGVFSFCTNLKSITIPDEVTSIGQYSFWNCTSLTSIILPPFVDSIYHDAFNNCSSLISITIPSSLRFIDYYAFDNCSSLQDVYYAGTSEEWNKISISDRNDCNDDLLNATIHYQSTGPEDEKKFTFGRDNLSFLNHSDYFFKRSNPIMSSLFDFIVKPNYINTTLALSDEKFDLLTKNYVPRVKTVLDLCRSSSWGGSCLGMTDVAAIHYISPYKLPFSAATTYDLAAPVNDKSVQDLINYYQILQYSPTLRKVAIDRAVFCGDNFDEAISEIVTSLNTGYPVLALIASEGHSSHFILLLNIQEETHEYYAIRVYDPNQSKEKILYLHKFFSEKIGQLPISYESCDVTYNRINYYLLCKNDLQFLDLRNFYGIGDNETATDYDENFVIVNSDYSLSLKWGRAYYRASNGKLVEYSDDITVIPDGSTMADGTYAGNLWISVPTPTDDSDFTLETSSSDTGLTSLLLNDTLLSISTSGPVELTYNEADRTVDVTAEDPTDVNLLMTKNDVDESWPWHSWALDTTGTTTLHADLDDDGLHLSGDGITNAKYATENADTENVDSGTISVQPDADGITAVTITNKKSSSGDSLEIVTPSAPTTGNAITITNGFAYIDDPEQPVNSAALGDVVTIVANDRSSEGKTFTGWVVNSGDVTLDDSSASPTSFTMGDKAVSITAQYSTNSTPTPNPGGGSSSGGGGGGGGGAAVLIGVGAAAAITAGVIMMSPVDVKGRVVLADQAAVPGAKISLLREGKVVAQTTADENGNFSLKAKRGSYELTAAYATADGQLIYKTIDIEAPAKDLTVTF